MQTQAPPELPVRIYRLILNLLTASLIFSAPTNLFFKPQGSKTYLNGLLVDYLIPKLYLSDLVILGLLIWLGLGIFLDKHQPEQILTNNKLLRGIVALLFSGLLIRQLLTPLPSIALLMLGKLILLSLTFYLLLSARKLLSTKWLACALLGALTFQSTLGLYQLLTQQSLAGYWFFGEPNLTLFYRLARGRLLGQQVILPYATSAHPNLLAGTLVLYSLGLGLIIFSNQHSQRLRNVRKLFYLLIPISMVVLVATQSISAFLSLATGLAIIFAKSRKINWPWDHPKLSLLILAGISLLFGLLLMTIEPPNPDLTSWTRRVMLLRAGLLMWLGQPLGGKGLNHFTYYLEEFSRSAEAVRFIQPVHHALWLWLVETGLIGVGFLTSLVLLLKKHLTQKLVLMMLTMLPIISLDHYLLSLQPGRLLIVISLIILTLSYDEESLKTDN